MATRNTNNSTRSAAAKKKSSTASGSGGSRNTSSRKPSSKKNNNRSAGKSSGAKTKTRGSSPDSEEINGAISVADHVIPLILVIIAIYMLICYVTHGTKEDVGSVGLFIRNLFFGLFSSAAWLIPFMLINIAFFYRRDLKVENHFNKYRIIFSLICLILISAAMHLFTKDKIVFEFKALYESGIESVDGGLIGGFAGQLLMVFGNIGASIITISLIIVFSPFLIGYTPIGLIKKCVQLSKDFQKSGYVREVKIENKTKNPDYKVTKRKYRIVSDRKLVNQKPFFHRKAKFNIDVPLEKDVEAEIKNKNNALTSKIDGNPFVEDESAEKNKKIAAEDIISVNNNTYEYPDIPFDADTISIETDEELNYEENIDYDKLYAGKTENIVLPDGYNSDENKCGENGKIFIPNEEIKAEYIPESVESAPVKRDDEPELIDAPLEGYASPEGYEVLKVEKSQVFEKIEARLEYVLPPISYLTKEIEDNNVDIDDELRSTSQKLIETLANFNIKVQIPRYSRGPTITRYEVAPEAGVKVSRIVSLVDDISLNLATGGIRIEAPIPGKAAVGVEVPNKVVSTVHLRSLIEDPKFTQAKSCTTVALGQDVAGNAIYSDIAKMPHLLIAGATGMGKSICMNSIITSILYKAKPNELKLILVDPKRVEFPIYNGIPHLLVPVISDSKKAAGSLAWAVNEMENRFMLMEERGVRDLKSYNEVIDGEEGIEKIPQIIIIIDELADLMMTAPADVEISIARITQKARAAGIHLILATQRPSVNVITGLIKSNIPSRIAFTVSSRIDSGIILDSTGAEKLIGRGDMLYLPAGVTKPIRVQGSYIHEKDIIKAVEFVKKQGGGEYDERIIEDINSEAQRCNTKGAKLVDRNDDLDVNDFEKESMLKPAIEVAIEKGTISTSLLQRTLSLGYGRAAKIVDMMERMNLVGPMDGAKPRKVLITRQEFSEMILSGKFGSER